MIVIAKYDLPKQGPKIAVSVLLRVSVLGIFCPKQGQVFTPSAVHPYTQTLVKYPPPQFKSQSLHSSCCFLSEETLLHFDPC